MVNVQERTKQDWTPAVQVANTHYGFEYDDYDHWVRHHWIIRNSVSRRLRKILDIGPGSGVVSWYLRKNGVQVTTIDIDASLHPDFLGSATALPFADGEFDGIICCEVLEHMPFEQSMTAIREIHRVTCGYAFVTVPRQVLSFALLLRMPLLHLRELRVRVPLFRKVPPYKGGQHYWELGLRGYPVSRLRKAFRDAGFLVESEKAPATNYSSSFFILKKLA